MVWKIYCNVNSLAYNVTLQQVYGCTLGIIYFVTDYIFQCMYKIGNKLVCIL